MKKINVNELKSNQILARAVVNENENIILYEGARIKKEHIQKLIENDVKEVYDNWSIGKGNMALDLGIGIPLFVIFTIIAFMLVMYQKKKDKAINDQSLNATK